VSRSGYYDARRPAKPLLCKTSIHLKAAFTASHQSYGSRRLATALVAQGIQIGRCRVRRLMRQADLKPVWKRKFIHTTDSKHNLPVAANILDRHFNPGTPNLAWVSDITYIRTGSGWLYLAIVLDLFSRKVVGWAMAPNMPAELVCAALRMAIQQRGPAPGLIARSDRGSQYASAPYQTLLAERFFLNLEIERVWQRDYADHAEAKVDIIAYIVGFYNIERLHSILGNLPPLRF
jgi:putative transposase